MIEDNKAYPFPGLGNSFPVEESKVPDPAFGLLRPLKLTNELALQVARLNHYSSKLTDALNSLADINDHLARGRLRETEEALAEHRRLYGLSLIALKKDLLAALERDGLAGLSRRYKSLTADCQNTAWALLAHYAYDMIDPTFNPTRAALRWLRLADGHLADDPWYARILQDELLTLSTDAHGLSCSLLRYSALSLLDLAILLWRKRNSPPFNSLIQSAFQNLTDPIKSTLIQRFSNTPLQVPRAYGPRDNGGINDTDIYRTSFFFDDSSSVVTWRCQLNPLIFAERPDMSKINLDANVPRFSGAANAIIEHPAQAQAAIQQLDDWQLAFLAEDSQLKSRTFLSAALIAESSRRMLARQQIDQSSVAELLSSTDDIQLFSSARTFDALLNSELTKRSKLLTFVLWELVYRQKRTQDNELDRRLAFMRLFDQNSSLTDVFETVAKTCPSTAILLARTCSRTFLERLFMMMSSVKDVLEARLEVCRWLIGKTDPASDTLQEECEALIRELENLEARSDLDSTRVHVDEESLREWFYTLHSASVSRYKQTAQAEDSGPSFGSLIKFFSNLEKPGPKVDDFTAETQIGSEFLLIAIVDATLKTFVSDRTFGLDAYLSRRIRHGTLNGHVMTPVTRALGRLAELVSLHEQAHASSDNSGAIRFAEDFRAFLLAELDHARKDVIQIQSAEHPKGLIQAQWRTPANIQHLDAMTARVRRRVIESNGAYDVFPDIYSFCWDCLESDLAQLRRYMLRDFLPAATRKLFELFEQMPSPDDKEMVYPFLHECRQIIEARIQEVCGWFIRPVFRRDRYSLKMLISTTLSIVRELDYEYDFSEDVVVSDDISLNRGSFDVFGDALFVLLGNAARHGKRDGHIHVSAQVIGGSNIVQLEVTSDVSSADHYRDAISRIDTAFNKDAQAIAQAAVQEGFSGLMKLAGLIVRVRSPFVALWVDGNEHNLTITFKLRLPSEITFTRMRG
ncbi:MULTISPECIES: hypothetical protein [unclassified Bradyrhizobium]|uniref:hypothetical protein n=1 Tax=unclassified Bradyrhizobium TaxID=2631580 RepID=UPI0028E949B2|nr:MULTISPECIES: hypothetical protein [unclassified Bradyrhizobium]